MALDYVGVLLFVAAGQSLAWAVFPKFDAIEKIGLGLAASLTVPALFSAALNFAGVPFSQLTVYAVFVALTLAGLAWVKFGEKKACEAKASAGNLTGLRKIKTDMDAGEVIPYSEDMF